jgi:hypothetical protein
MGVVVAAAVGVAALRFANEWWAGGLFLATLGVLGLAILGAVYRRGAKRAGWLGAALFGWGYLALALAPWAVATSAPGLPTTMLLNLLYARAHPNQASTTSQQVYDLLINGIATTTPPATAPTPWGPMPMPANPPGYAVAGLNSTPTLTWALTTTPAAPPEPFLRVGHCLWAWLAAVVGAIAGRIFFATKGEPSASVATGGTP